MNRRSSALIPYATLEEAFNALTAQEVRDRTAFLGLKGGTRKEHHVAALVNYLSPERLREMWDSMDDLTRYAVAEVVHNSALGVLNVRRFVAKYGALPPHEYRVLSRKQSQPMTVFDVLFTNDSLPTDLIGIFYEFVPEPPVSSLPSRTDLPETSPDTTDPDANETISFTQPLAVLETEAAALHDLIALLRLIDIGKVSVSASTGKASLASAKEIIAVLRDGDFVSHTGADKTDDLMRAFAWPLLLQNASLVMRKGSKLVLTKSGTKALSQPPEKTLKYLWERWLKKSKFDEFNRMNDIKGQKTKGRGGLTAVQDRRQAVALALIDCPVGEWVYIDDLFRYVMSTDLEFDLTNNPWRLYLCEPQYGSLGYDGYHRFELLQGRYMMALLWEYMGTLGMLDIAHVDADGARRDFRHLWGADDLSCLSRYDGLTYFRITPLGAYCLGLSPSYAPAPKATQNLFQVLPNHDIVVINKDNLCSSDALFLERIANSTGDHTWTLDRSRILDALAGGISEEDIKHFLDNNSIEPTPETVHIFITDIARRATQVRYEGPAEVYYTNDEATALLIAHDSKTKALCYRSGKNRLVVPAGKATAFQRALRQLGFCAPHPSQV